MPQWAGSCWYYLRFLDNHNDKEIFDKDKEKKWMPVDLYVGGAEHAVLHLLYSRFWHKFLYDIGVVSTKEPFYKLRNIGLILAPDGQKMSKSKGNVISPDVIVDEFGADTLRAYEMFMGPFDQAIQWNEQGVKGVNRFLNKAWDIIISIKDNAKSSPEVIVATHKLNKKVADDLEKMKFNTPVAFFMEFFNFIAERKEEFGREEIERVLKLLSPFAPHLCEELWSILGNKESILLEKWPEPHMNLIKEEKVVLAIQVNGKGRERSEMEVDLSKEEAEEIVMNNEKVKKWIDGKEVKEVFYVPNKLINICVA
jgi:leucyl-tRNA synthetase